MQKLAANLTEKMLRRKLISPEQAEWCAYLVECKLEQMLCFSVLIALGCLIAPLWEVLLLNWGVVFLRRKANGLHLHTFAGCMLSSLCCELTALWACEKVTPAVKRGEIRKQAKSLKSSRLWTAGKQVTTE